MKLTRKGDRLGPRRQRALSMVVLMVLMSMGPLLTTPVVSAHAEPSGVTWPLQGSNDTGWVTLDAGDTLASREKRQIASCILGILVVQICTCWPEPDSSDASSITGGADAFASTHFAGGQLNTCM